MATTAVYDRQVSGFVDAQGNAFLPFSVDPGGYAAVYLSAEASGTPLWKLGKNGNPRFFDQASAVVLGPLSISPNERAEVTLTGATPNTSITGELWGVLADSAIVALSALPTPSSRAGLAVSVPNNPGVGSPMILLDQQSAAGTRLVTFSNINQTYRHLLLKYRFINWTQAGNVIYVSANNDFTAANYGYEGMEAAGAVAPANVSSGAGGDIGIWCGRSSLVIASGSVEISRYANLGTVVQRRTFLVQHGRAEGTVAQVWGNWSNTVNPITVLTLYVQAAQGTGTIDAELYGEP